MNGHDMRGVEDIQEADLPRDVKVLHIKGLYPTPEET
jgi:hypothetical protein